MKTIAAVMVTVFSWRVNTVPMFQAQYSYTVYMLAICSVVTDVWNTTVLCWFLFMHRTRHSRGLVNRIIIWAIGEGISVGSCYVVRADALCSASETGFLTSLAAILTVIFVCTAEFRIVSSLTIWFSGQQCLTIAYGCPACSSILTVSS
jgi:hypothetical protein